MLSISWYGKEENSSANIIDIFGRPLALSDDLGMLQYAHHSS